MANYYEDDNDYNDDDGDDGFVGYVPNTVNPGPLLLIATIAVTLLIMLILPAAVVLGEKYGEKGRRRSSGRIDDEDDDDDDISDEDTDNDSSDVGGNGHPHPTRKKRNSMNVLGGWKQRQQTQQQQQHGDNTDAEDFSVSSNESFYSTVSEVLKEIMDPQQSTCGGSRPIRGGGRHGNRLRRRHRTKIERRKQNPAELYSVELTTSKETAEESQCSDGDGQQSFEIPSNDPRSNDYSSSSGGDGSRLYSEKDCDGDNNKPRIDRNVCLSIDGLLDEIAMLMAWDVEMRRLIKLSLPFATQALCTGVLDTLTVGVVGTLIGTREVSAFVVSNLLIQLSTTFVGGFHEALATLASQAIGANKPRLAGKYVQIAVVLYSLSYVPFACFWGFCLHDAIIWLGLMKKLLRLGNSGHERYSTMIGVIEEVLAFLTILIWALVGSPSLLMVGLVQFGWGVIFLSITVSVVWMKGWFLAYRPGMVGTFALKDKKAVKMVCKTAASLAFGYLLTDGEWEVLTIFASFLGPAEVAAWGILGTIWDAINELLDGISDASEVRCAFLLGSDQPERARQSAYKSMMIGVFTSLFTTSILFMCGDDLPTWLTSDPTLQHLLRDLLPMFGIGNAALCLGSSSWTLLGAQGRYQLATAIVFLVSWLFTLPMSAMLSIHFRVSLEGQTAAVVVGYMISGAIHSYFLFRSDWVALSQNVMDDNCSRASDDDSLLKDVPTNADMSDFEAENSLITDGLDRLAIMEAMSSLQPEATKDEVTSPSLESAGVQAGGKNLPNPPSRRNLFSQSMGLPNPPSGEGPPSARGFFSFPNPPSFEGRHIPPTSSFRGEGPTLLYTLSGEENDSPKEVEVELCTNS